MKRNMLSTSPIVLKYGDGSSTTSIHHISLRRKLPRTLLMWTSFRWGRDWNPVWFCSRKQNGARERRFLGSCRWRSRKVSWKNHWRWFTCTRTSSKLFTSTTAPLLFKMKLKELILLMMFLLHCKIWQSIDSCFSAENLIFLKWWSSKEKQSIINLYANKFCWRSSGKPPIFRNTWVLIPFC